MGFCLAGIDFNSAFLMQPASLLKFFQQAKLVFLFHKVILTTNLILKLLSILSAAIRLRRSQHEP